MEQIVYGFCCRACSTAKVGRRLPCNSAMALPAELLGIVLDARWTDNAATACNEWRELLGLTQLVNDELDVGHVKVDGATTDS